MSIGFAKLYEKQNRSVGIASWHIQFCTKYRSKMFSKLKYKNLIQVCIKRICLKHNIELVVLNVLPDHIHLIAKVSINFNLSRLLQLIKGSFSYLFFKYHPKACLRYPCGHLGGLGKFIASVGFTDLDFTISYVLHQEEHHFLSHGNQVL